MWHHDSSWFMVISAMAMCWVVAVSLVVVGLHDRGMHRGIHPGFAVDRAERILSERYARGEIDTDEYRRRLQTIQH